ncbi:MAG: hypothetical protein ACR2RF_14455, partial [Geminicoccaceae bacterium]
MSKPLSIDLRERLVLAVEGGVRRQGIWGRWQLEIREALAHRVDGIMQPRFDAAIVFVGWSVV